MGYTGTMLLEDRWFLDDLKYGSGLARNKMIMLQGSSMRTREDVAVGGRPWEISFTWEYGCERRPHRRWVEWKETERSSFALTFSESDHNRFRFDLNSDECGIFLDHPDRGNPAGECSASCREAVAQSGPHTLSIKRKGNSVIATVDNDVCASAETIDPNELLRVELVTRADSCVAFDDLILRVEETESGWRTLIEEDFDTNPFQTCLLDRLFDLDSRAAWIAITWAGLAVALIIDLAMMVWIGRRSPISALLAMAVPQAILFLALQELLLLPYIPLLCTMIVVWISKGLLALFGKPQREQRIYYKRPWLLIGMVGAATLLAVILELRTEIEQRAVILTLASVQAAAFLVLLAGRWKMPEYKWGLVLWFSLSGAQILHWHWIKEVWSLFGFDTLVFASLIPMALIICLYSGAIRQPAWMGVTGRLLAVGLTLFWIELATGTIPIGTYLEFEYRIEDVFWNLHTHSNLIVDHSREEIYEDSMGAVYQREKPSGVYRILCLGSSSTQGATEYISPDEIDTLSYPAQLGRLMNDCLPGSVEVINAGIGGYTLTKLRIYFEHILSDLDPDLMILYFGLNSDSPSDLTYYERVESLLEKNPEIDSDSQAEIEAGLSLRWPHTILIRAYIFVARSRIFMGMKLILDKILQYLQDDTQDRASEEFKEESAGLLVEAALNSGASVLLIPEITNSRFLVYESVYAKLIETCADEPVYMKRIEEFDVTAHIFDDVHMTAAGYRELAGIIASYLVESGLVRCESERNNPGG